MNPLNPYSRATAALAALFICLLIAGCSDDGVSSGQDKGTPPQKDGSAQDRGGQPDQKITTPDKGSQPDQKIIAPDKGSQPDQKIIAPDKAVQFDQKITTPDKAVLPDQKITTPDKAVLPDQTKPLLDFAGPSPDQYVPTFTLTGLIDFSPSVGCTPSDKNKDCTGDMLLAIFDKPFNPASPSNALSVSGFPNMKKGDTFTAKGLKIGPTLYMVAFIDDNSNIIPSTPAPDTGDPLFINNTPFSAKDGQTITQNITFLGRVP